MSDRSKGFNPAVLSGGALILVGVLLLLDQMGLISFDFWAVVIGAFGLLRFIQASNPTGRLWGLLLMAVGAAIELAPLGFVKIHLEETWPVFVIAAGVILIWRAYQQSSEAGGALSPHLNVFSILGGGEYRIRAKNFRGGDLVAFMGGFDVNLKDADIENSEAVITVNCLMGGGVIRVPETWAVSMRVAAFMGGHSLKAREGSQPTKTLIVKGIAIMGGVEVRN
jgi:Cell wall-active antibiotics response 4TMS YvqF